MKAEKDPFIEELTGLFLLAVEGMINAEQFERLQTLMTNSASIRKYYYDFVNTYVGMNDPKVLSSESMNLQSPLLDEDLWKNLAEAEKAALPVLCVKEPPAPQFVVKSQMPKLERTFNKSSLAAAAISIAAVLLLIVSFQFLPSKAARPVASLSRGFNTRWESSQADMTNGVRLWNDGQWYNLAQGVAEIIFDSGAKILIEAPSEFQVLNENEMLFEGSMTASVPQSALGFTINTSNSRVVDLGTEFGLRSLEDRTSEVHVTRGKVEMAAVISHKISLKQPIEAGQGYGVDESGRIEKIPFGKEGFRWVDPSPYEQAVYKTKPLNYWRFDRPQGKLLRNEMNPQLRPLNELVGTLAYGAGPAMGSVESANAALRLDGSNENYIIMSDHIAEFRRTDAVTISMWVYPEAGVRTDQSILLATNEKGPDTNFNDQIFLTSGNQFGFYVYCAKALRRVHITSHLQVVPNHWYHVVACRTAETGKLYVNGQLVAAENLPAPGGESPSRTYWCIGKGTGRYADYGSAFQKWPFKGMVDEISQYDRELSASEVQSLYQAASVNSSR